ncbi:small ribosomal subunit Rsm22 family protein [Leekyejoonella antrihumi]|uniref:rRNA methyltransferase n=1 Tax=Leekyejoonella antrihumi TaxID=1660198 RepID=A0A563E6U3_9MICO|nr:small ribosomal subunit Rsm22 family protein [Leekyejoonella antrihumi]TWP38019.1 rRNA methyltransferase [Leekyejoonella antrihumi]
MSDSASDPSILLRRALDQVADTRPAAQIAASVERLITRYRAGGAATAPILRDPVDALAYALYRMPSTYAAVTAALGQASLRWVPAGPGVRTVLDLGGGTGGAAWAATRVWPQARVQVVDQVQGCLDLGRQLAGDDAPISFGSWRLGEALRDPADVVTVSYVLSELTERQQREIVDQALKLARMAVLVIEPGTPDGYARVLGARDRLLAQGWTVVAPCPHQGACPLAGSDWCHFAARVDRSAVHRRLKQGSLGHEDEKFSYVFAVQPGQPVPGDPAPRVIRHPVKRKGLVDLQLCRPDATVGRAVVTKRQGTTYKQARSVSWGDSYTTP